MSANGYSEAGSHLNARGYLKVARVPFLLLPVSLTVVGASASAYAGEFDLTNTALALVGLVLLNVSVNALNEYSDWRRGIDEETEPTKFSGGSKALVEKELKPKGALVLGVFTLFVSFLIGLYFLYIYGVAMVPLIVVGGVLVVGYTDIFARVGLGEFSAGLGLGALPVVGVGFVQSGSVAPVVVAASVPCFFLTFNLLLLNEFPDLDADTKGGRTNLITLLGKTRAKYAYVGVVALCAVSLVSLVASGYLPLRSLLALAAFALLYRPVLACLRDDGITEAALGRNVGWVIVTNLLLGVSLLEPAWFLG
ncbi:MAG: prenyltransferase [Halobacteriales archaeon]|nr:prenyltransferase [Halobacteriales archaeon]